MYVLLGVIECFYVYGHSLERLYISVYREESVYISAQEQGNEKKYKIQDLPLILSEPFKFKKSDDCAQNCISISLE